MRNYGIGEITAFCTRLLVAKGVPEANARYIAEQAVRTEAFGVTTHGLAVMGALDEALDNGLDPRAEPVIVRERAATALLDGNNGIGQIAMRCAKELAVRKARESGIAMVGVRNSTWLGAVGIYLLSLAEAGFLAQLWAQSTTCKDCAPVGGIDARFSTNPVGLAFPAGGDPMVADLSTASYAMGKVLRMIRRGEKAPEPLFLDRRGDFSEDPGVVKEDGSILFTGGRHVGHKGYALSLWCEALTAVAGGNCNNPEAKSHQNFNLTVIDPNAFAGAEAYLAEIKRFVAHVKSSRLRPGCDAIRLPGERGFRCLREAERNGLPLDDDRIRQLNMLARKNNVPEISSVR